MKGYKGEDLSKVRAKNIGCPIQRQKQNLKKFVTSDFKSDNLHFVGV